MQHKLFRSEIYKPIGVTYVLHSMRCNCGKSVSAKTDNEVKKIFKVHLKESNASR